MPGELLLPLHGGIPCLPLSNNLGTMPVRAAPTRWPAGVHSRALHAGENLATAASRQSSVFTAGSSGGFIHKLRRCRFPVGEAIAPARFMCGVLSFRSVSVSVSGSLSGALPCVTPALPVVSLLLSFPSAAAFSARFFSRKAFTRAAESSSRLGCRFAHPVTKSPSRTFPCIAARICSTCSMSRSKELAMSSAHRFLSSRVRLRFPALHLRYQSFHWHLMR